MMLKQKRIGAIAALCIAFSSFTALAWQNPFADSLQPNKFPPVAQVFQLDYSQVDAKLRVSFDISDGFYMYQHRFNFTPAEKLSAPLQLPAGENYSDQFFGDTVIYRHHVELMVDLNAAARNEVLTVHFQGCADEGFCYPPSTLQIFLRRTAGTSSGTGVTDTTAISTPDTTAVNLAATKTTPNLLWLVLLAFSIAGFWLARWLRKK
ncbi:protein-disulfide reductase DsbD domain-containing protein [Aliidiomarina quisquiliarum]|uniref:protein-disulfide reductase DsbD domain-containing protein n=1 Tax=Aliidiomarina quisquiliarum TaxID=2938947 RepID=UPI00208F8462|nr:protein-disulfide reductase DsbD domain-containing protein [Aliidiomarina quisquiliarum]MCO4321169.1 hypothetical protein [Aliidiomarina quisquiliarum]